MPSHVDLSVLWVPIMPETSKLGPAMEEAGKDATETFGKATSGIGDRIHDSFTKATGKVKDVFHKAGNDASESMADGVKEQSRKVEDALEDTGKKAHSKFRDAVGDIGKEMVGAISPDIKQQLSARVEDVVGGAFKSAFGDEGIAGMVGGAVSKAAGEGFGSWIDSVKSKVDGVKGAADNTRKAFADFSSGNTQAGVSKLVDSFGKLGLDVKDLPVPLQGVVDKTNAAKVQAQQFADIFTGMPGIVGRLGTAISGLAGPLSLVIGLSYQLYQEQHASNEEMRRAFQDPALRAAMEHRESDQHPFAPAAPDKPLPPMDLTSKTAEAQLAASGDQEALRDLQLRAAQGDQEAATLLRDNNLSTAIPAAPRSGGPLGSWFGGGTGPKGGWFGGGGHPASFAPRDVGSDKGLTPTSSNVKKTISTMFPEISDIGGWRPPDGFNEHSSGQALDVMIPGAGTPQGKALGDQIKNYVLSHAKELGVDYALWQQAQWNPDGSHSGMENRGSPTQNHMDHVHIHTVRGGGDGTMPTDAPSSAPGSRGGGGSLGSSAGMNIPTGAQHDPLYIMPADSSGGGAGGSSSESQGQQLGSGLVNGVLQEFGLDGSVFKTFGGSSNPLQFGITKLATGLINTFAGGGQQGGGSLGGGGGSILPGLGALIPQHGSVPIGPGGAQNVRTGETQNATNHFYDSGPQLTVNQYGVKSPTDDLHAATNGAANRMPAMGTTNNSGNVPH